MYFVRYHFQILIFSKNLFWPPAAARDFTVHVCESLHYSGMEDFSFPYRREPYTWGLFSNKKDTGFGFFCL